MNNYIIDWKDVLEQEKKNHISLTSFDILIMQENIR